MGGGAGGCGVRQGVGARAQTHTPIPNPFHPWPPIFTHTYPLNPFTHGPKHSHTPIPTPPSPMTKTHTPSPNPFHPWPPIHTHTHPLNPFTHGPKHSHTPIPTPLHPWPRHIHLALTHFTHDPQYVYTHPSPKPFHPWAQTLSYTHPHTPFTHDQDTYT